MSILGDFAMIWPKIMNYRKTWLRSFIHFLWSLFSGTKTSWSKKWNALNKLLSLLSFLINFSLLIQKYRQCFCNVNKWVGPNITAIFQAHLSLHDLICLYDNIRLFTNNICKAASLFLVLRCKFTCMALIFINKNIKYLGMSLSWKCSMLCLRDCNFW